MNKRERNNVDVGFEMVYDEAGGFSVATAGTLVVVVASATAGGAVVVGAEEAALFSEGVLLFACCAGFGPNKFRRKLPNLANAPGLFDFSWGGDGDGFFFIVFDFVEGVRVRVLSFGTASELAVVIVVAAVALLTGG